MPNGARMSDDAAAVSCLPDSRADSGPDTGSVSISDTDSRPDPRHRLRADPSPRQHWAGATPGKARWESNMLTKGRTQCEYEKTVVNAWKAGTGSLDPGMSYYDG